ncbi:MAG TPA: hypothetical protein VGU03_03005 [Frateuria sp.]|uniref:hypothetical protein n=1 Tax=Frateuria sp. TaxID=2211372 RepID=UPI002DE69D5A|nr:hypothetical protein [Frateuria sp.]
MRRDLSFCGSGAAAEKKVHHDQWIRICGHTEVDEKLLHFLRTDMRLASARSGMAAQA